MKFFLLIIIIINVIYSPGYTQQRLGIQDSVTSNLTRIALFAVCFRILLRFANSLLILGDAIVYRIASAVTQCLIATLEFY